MTTGFGRMPAEADALLDWIRRRAPRWQAPLAQPCKLTSSDSLTRFDLECQDLAVIVLDDQIYLVSAWPACEPDVTGE